MGRIGCPETSVFNYHNSPLTPEDGIDRLSRNVVINYHYSPRNNPEQHSSQLLRDGKLKSRTADNDAVIIIIIIIII
jgi:hypothetical protein